MAPPSSPPSHTASRNAGVRAHGRHISISERASNPPLQATSDDPLAASPPVSVSAAPRPPPPSKSDLLPAPHVGPHDVRFLQNRDTYHSLSTEDVPPSFLTSSQCPPLDASLSLLLQTGHFRPAAEAAVRLLLQCPPTAADQVLDLLYVRLACLVLLSRMDIAAAEAFPLVDHLARNSPAAQDLAARVPWHLRLLLVRLQSIGAADGGRRGIMALYALAGETRARLRHAQRSGDDAAVAVWSARLHDLGLRVCDALVEMGELDTAMRHLDGLADGGGEEVAYRKALLRVRVGDVVGARQFVHHVQEERQRCGLEALLQVADGDYTHALTSWRTLMREFPHDEQFVLNAAVSLLYTGHMTAARDLLEQLAQDRPLFPTVLFNLCTMYELCTERAVERKTSLTQRAAAKPPAPDSGGWERGTFEFKL